MLPSIHHASSEQTAAVHPDLTVYASLELSRSTWLVTCLLPESDRMSKYSTPGGDGCALLGKSHRGSISALVTIVSGSRGGAE
jgi:hypothetical protein